MAKKKNIALLILGPVLFLGIIAAAGYLYYKHKYIPEFEARAAAVNASLKKHLFEKILLSPALVISSEGEKYYKLTARMPLRYSMDSLKKELHKTAEAAGTEVSFKEVDLERLKSLNAEFTLDNRVCCQARFVRNSRPKIAVIIDDWGYSPRPLEFLSSIKQHFAPAILPGLAYTKKASELSHKAGREIMLHLPLQPKREMPMEKDVIKNSMSEGEIRHIIQKQLALVPHASGLNNHEGSLATEDRRVMGVIMKELKNRNLYFIDSVTAEKSVVVSSAKSEGVLSAGRHVFLDNEKNAVYIRGQIAELKEIALKRGYAVGIGHADMTTMQVLAEDMPLIEKEGFEFVTPAEVVR